MEPDQHKAYIVSRGYYDDYRVLAVFTDLDMAEKVAGMMNAEVETMPHLRSGKTR